MVVSAFVKHEKQKQDELVTQAWLTACWQRVKKLEPLNNILNISESKVKNEMTDDEMMKMCMHLNKLFGGEAV